MLTNKRIGILGGGQLGKMVCEAAAKWHLHVAIMDTSTDMPAANYCSQFIEGNFKSYDDVIQFGNTVDIISVEIEHVNIDALDHLKTRGIQVYPDPAILRKIIDKGLQKQLYISKGMPTAPFILVKNKEEILTKIGSNEIRYPFVQKSRTEGYDGRGVAVINHQEDLEKIMDTPSVIEQKIDIKTELGVIVARNPQGQIEVFPPVEMKFDQEANLLDELICPAQLDPGILLQAINLARELAEQIEIIGLLAVELFVDKDDRLFVNEIAPRPHNSGHHTIEACNVSQFEQFIRAIADFPLLPPVCQKPSVMINLLGEPGYSGNAILSGAEEVLGMDQVFIHWYGKKQTKPARKMGHVTILGDSIQEAHSKALDIRKILKVIST
jgi:5-(carboxyamino)imidazole ribonucleotide synthase